jgi:hypothetical protein
MPGQISFIYSHISRAYLSTSGQGKDMAQWSVWISAASILATFDISKTIDEKGVPIEPSGEYTSGLIWCVLDRL